MEIWKNIVGSESCMVSSLGRVRGVRGGILRASRTRAGHLQVSIGGKRVTVSSLVMRAFVGDRPPGAHINHKNFDVSDNRVANLEYCTPQQNIDHLTLHYWKHNSKRLSEQVYWLRKLGGTHLKTFLKTSPGHAAIALWGDKVAVGSLGKPKKPPASAVECARRLKLGRDWLIEAESVERAKEGRE